MLYHLWSIDCASHRASFTNLIRGTVTQNRMEYIPYFVSYFIFFLKNHTERVVEKNIEMNFFFYFFGLYHH